MDPTNVLSKQIKQKAKELGFYDCGIAKAGFIKGDAERLKKWLDEGKQAEMAYMENHFEKRTDPGKLLEGAKSVISVLYNYYPHEHLKEENNYKISRYAYGTDYHLVLKKKLKKLIVFIKTIKADVSARAFVDSAPVLERSWAARAGLGWIGKNTCLITKEQGSYFFIGEIVTDLELDYDRKMVPNHCGGCTRCLDACPTRALSKDGLDANKCISYWTIEFKGESLPDSLQDNFGDWIFGCDVCQQICPWNRLSEPHNEPKFDLTQELLKMRKPDWEKLSEIEFVEVFKGSAVKRTKYKGLMRNIHFVKK
ncbi:MAG: tRNA epoxyqueuosine(34) reductase QueG [Bacteroidales bacterium]|nr:tRNA epoxyqueuosine(34) reductase QueG [Bacteroidales bacterium]